MVRIDPAAARQIHTILSLCRSRGQDPVVALDAAGMLRHIRRIHQDNMELVDMLIDFVRNMRSEEISNWPVRRTSTPLDQKNFIIWFLENVVKKGMIEGGNPKIK